MFSLIRRKMEVNSVPSDPGINPGFMVEMGGPPCSNIHTSHMDITDLGNVSCPKVNIPSLGTSLSDCLPDCLCSVIPVDSPDGPTNTTTLDVDEIYQVLGKDILRSSLLEDIGLYLECDEDSLDALPSKSQKNRSKSPRGASPSWSGSEVKLCWTLKGPAADTESKVTRFACPQCPKTFARDSLMRDHRYKVHGDQNLFPCGFCNYQGHCFRLLQKHMARKHKDATSKGPDILTKVSAESTGNNSERIVSEQNNVQAHNLSSLPIDSLQTSPGQSRTDNEVIANSVIIKVKPKCGIIQNIPIPGTECFIVTEVVEETTPNSDHTNNGNNSQQQIPVKKQNPTKSYSCDACSYVCKSARLLQRHKQAMHNAEREVHCCDKCGRMFKQKRSLDTHMKVHSSLFEYHCDKCLKSFASTDHLRLHQRVHIGSREFVCSFPQCGMAFRTNGHLQQHERNVHGPELFQCPEPGCKKGFSLQRLAEAHYKVHTPAYRCFHASCSRTFRDKYNLNVHQKTHRSHAIPEKKDGSSPELLQDDDTIS